MLNNPLFPVIPPYAKLVFGKNWGGWAWLSLLPNGRVVWWLIWFSVGFENPTAAYFYSISELEYFTDAIESDAQIERA